MKTILFLHGFFASGSCIPAIALHESLDEKYMIRTPDLPLHPQQALDYIRELCGTEQPDLLVGNSCGSFYGQMIANETGIPALLSNPYFLMTEFLNPRIGAHQYKSPRKNGCQNFFIDQRLIDEFASIEKVQFETRNPAMQNKIWGLFGEQDTLAHFEPMFLKYYDKVFHFPGGHTPNGEEIKTYYLPLIEQMLRLDNVREE